MLLPVLLSLFRASAVADLSASCDEFDQWVSLLSGGKLARLLSSVFFFPSKDSLCLNCSTNRDSDAGQATIYTSLRFFYAHLSTQCHVCSINCDNHLGYGCLMTRLKMPLGSTSCDTSHTPVSRHLDCRMKPRGHMSGSRQKP